MSWSGGAHHAYRPRQSQGRWFPVAGHFELVTDPDGSCRVKLIDGRGRELAISAPYSDSNAAVRGITAFREVAATAVIKDNTSGAPRKRAARPSLQNK